MTWEELSKKYDRESERMRLEDKNTGRERDWYNLMRSTDKLLWLLRLTTSSAEKQAKTAKR